MPAASKDLSLSELGMMCDPGKMSVNAVVVLIFKTNVQYLDIFKEYIFMQVNAIRWRSTINTSSKIQLAQLAT